jgi:hypothetical protein
MELTEWGVQDIWNQNKPDEVRSKYNLSELIRMLKDENGGNSIFFCQSPLLQFRRRKEDKRVACLDGAGAGAQLFPWQLSPELLPWIFLPINRKSGIPVTHSSLSRLVRLMQPQVLLLS